MNPNSSPGCAPASGAKLLGQGGGSPNSDDQADYGAGRRPDVSSLMKLRVATWNINSVRIRTDQIARFVAEHAPDVICLQEIKCRDGEFPTNAFAEMGLPHVAIKGQKGWHGVATVSRLPIEAGPVLDLCKRGEAREVCAVVAGVEIHNFYIPAGGDTPDRELNPKFDHKLDFFERLAARMATRDPKAPLLVTGDLNVAPGEHDVWNHKYMSRIVSHTPVEIEAMKTLQTSLGFVDLVREAIPRPGKALQLVELSRGGLSRLGPGPAPRPPLGFPRPRPEIDPRSPRPRRRPRLGAPLRPRPGQRGPRRLSLIRAPADTRPPR